MTRYDDSVDSGRWRLLSVCGAWVLAVACLGLTGCSDGMAQVTGVITVDGVPLAAGEGVNGTVCLYPEDGTGAAAIGAIDAEGRYTIRTGSRAGVKPGPYTVTVSASEIIPSKVQGTAPSGRAITDRRYANPKLSGLRMDVEPGSNEFSYDLKPIKRTARR